MSMVTLERDKSCSVPIINAMFVSRSLPLKHKMVKLEADGSRHERMTVTETLNRGICKVNVVCTGCSDT